MDKYCNACGWTPPKTLEEGFPCLLDPRMADKFRGIGPLQHLRPIFRRDKQMLGVTGTGTWQPLSCQPHFLLNLPGQSSNHTRGWKNYYRPFSRILLLQKLAGQGVRLDVAETRMVGETKVKTGEEHGPSCLAGVQSLGCLDVFQVLVVSQNQKRSFGAF